MADLMYEGVARSIILIDFNKAVWFFTKAFGLSQNIFRIIIVLVKKLIKKLKFMTEQVNQKRLFIASCLALLVTAITFAIRARIESVFTVTESGARLISKVPVDVFIC